MSSEWLPLSPVQQCPACTRASTGDVFLTERCWGWRVLQRRRCPNIQPGDCRPMVPWPRQPAQPRLGRARSLQAAPPPPAPPHSSLIVTPGGASRSAHQPHSPIFRTTFATPTPRYVWMVLVSDEAGLHSRLARAGPRPGHWLPRLKLPCSLPCPHNCQFRTDFCRAVRC